MTTAVRTAKRPRSSVGKLARGPVGGNGQVHGPLCGQCNWPVDTACGECGPPADGETTREEARATSRPGHGGPRQIVEVPLDKLHRHPGNRVIKDSTCKELAKDLQARGLLQPIQIRDPGTLWQLPEGHYQIVFGERRAIAARLAGWDTIPAEIVTLDDRATQEAIAAENGHRAQLNDVERARRLAEMTKPVEQGGGGLTQTAAAAAMGIDQSTASTLLKLLTLPKDWRDLVIAGAMPGSHLRPLLPYAGCQPILDLLLDDYQRAQKSQWREERQVWATREGVEQAVQDVLESETRPLTTQDLTRRESDFDKPRFYATPEQTTLLQVVELPSDGKTIRRCLNVAEWSKLQQAAPTKAGTANRVSRATGENGKPAAKAKPTAADLRAAEKEQDWQLTERITRPQGLAEIALRLAMATRIGELVKQHGAGCRETELVAEVLLDAGRDSPGSAELRAPPWRYLANRLLRADRLDKAHSPTQPASGGRKPAGEIAGFKNHEAYAKYTLETDRASDDYRSDGERRRAYMARLILWPQSDGRIHEPQLAKRDVLPDRWPAIDEAILGELAYELGASIRDTWEAATRTGPARQWLDAFLATYQTRRHVVTLCEELGVLDAAHLNGKETLDALRRAIVGQHEQRTLPMPEALKGYPKVTKRGRTGRR